MDVKKIKEKSFFQYLFQYASIPVILGSTVFVANFSRKPACLPKTDVQIAYVADVYNNQERLLYNKRVLERTQKINQNSIQLSNPSPVEEKKGQTSTILAGNQKLESVVNNLGQESLTERSTQEKIGLVNNNCVNSLSDSNFASLSLKADNLKKWLSKVKSCFFSQPIKSSSSRNGSLVQPPQERSRRRATALSNVSGDISEIQVLENTPQIDVVERERTESAETFLQAGLHRIEDKNRRAEIIRGYKAYETAREEYKVVHKNFVELVTRQTSNASQNKLSQIAINQELIEAHEHFIKCHNNLTLLRNQFEATVKNAIAEVTSPAKKVKSSKKSKKRSSLTRVSKKNKALLQQKTESIGSVADVSDISSEASSFEFQPDSFVNKGTVDSETVDEASVNKYQQPWGSPSVPGKKVNWDKADKIKKGKYSGFTETQRVQAIARDVENRVLDKAGQTQKIADQQANELLDSLSCNDRRCVVNIINRLYSTRYQLEAAKNNNQKVNSVDLLYDPYFAQNAISFTGKCSKGSEVVGFTSLEEAARLILTASEDFRTTFRPDPAEPNLKIEVPFTAYKIKNTVIDYLKKKRIDTSELNPKYLESEHIPNIHHNDKNTRGGADSLVNASVLSKGDHGILHGVDEIERIYRLGKPGLDSNRRPFGAFIRSFSTETNQADE